MVVDEAFFSTEQVFYCHYCQCTLIFILILINISRSLLIYRRHLITNMITSILSCNRDETTRWQCERSATRWSLLLGESSLLPVSRTRRFKELSTMNMDKGAVKTFSFRTIRADHRGGETHPKRSRHIMEDGRDEQTGQVHIVAYIYL